MRRSKDDKVAAEPFTSEVHEHQEHEVEPVVEVSDVDAEEFDDDSVPEVETDSARADDDGALDKILGSLDEGELSFRVEIGDAVFMGRGPKALVGAALGGLGDYLRF